MANADRTRKLLVRSALVTSTTIATMVGAQNLALIDARDFQPTDTVSIDAPTIAHIAPDIIIQQAAPSITILRQSAQMAMQAAQSAPTSIQPPAPSQISAPAPVVIQQPAPQTGRSSR